MSPHSIPNSSAGFTTKNEKKMRPDLIEVAERISKNAASLKAFLDTRGFPQPSFAVDAAPHFPNEPAIEAARESILQDTKTLSDLVLGPVERLKWTIWPMIDISVLQVIYRFRVAQAVPFDGGATYTEIAHKTGLSHHRVASVIRQAMTNNIFHEDKLNHVVHTAMSAVLLNDPVMWDWVGHYVEEAFPTCAKWTEAMVRYPNSQEPSESPFAVAFGDSAPQGFFKYLADNNVPQARFFGAMKGVGTAPGMQHHHVANGYAWDQLGSATVVDVGGSAGHVSIEIAKKFPNLSFVVQDFPHTVQEAEKTVPSEFKKRITYMPHDFFKPQPVRGRAFLMRHICHDWSDTYSIKILQQIVPAMDPDSKIILVENVVLPPGQYSFFEEKWTRNMDLHMFSMLNSQERSADEWNQLIAAADPRLRINKIDKAPGSDDSIIEVVLA